MDSTENAGTQPTPSPASGGGNAGNEAASGGKPAPTPATGGGAQSNTPKDLGELAPTLLKGLQSAFNASAVQFANERLGLDKVTAQPETLGKLQGENESKIKALENEYKFLLTYQLGEQPGQAAKFDTKTWNIFGINVAVILALVVVAGFFVVVYLFFHDYGVDPLTEEDNLPSLLEKYKEMFIMLLGALTSVMVQVVQFFFGSSASSAGKNQLLAQQAQSGK